MKNRNIYKNIVVCAGVCILIIMLVRLGKSWNKEQKLYGFTITTESEITEETTAQFENITGIYRFEPAASMAVTIELEGYTMETELKVVDWEQYPLKYKNAQEKILLGSTPTLFFGIETFQGFTDQHGNSPGKSQINKWKKNYVTLSPTITDKNGRVKKAKISALLEDPGNSVCIDKKQMEEIFGKLLNITGGYMEIWGYQNTQDAKVLLEQGGFIVEEPEK